MRRQAAPAALALLAGTLSACGGDASATIDPDVFVDTYVELRFAAIQSPDFAVTPEQREEILARHGIDAAALLAFVDARGRNPDYMNEIWRIVDERLTTRRAAAEAGIAR